MNEQKTTLPSPRNIEWRTIKIETEKINQILTYIQTKNITELNELIYAGAKLVCENIGLPLKSTNKKSKPGWEIRLEMQIKKLRKQTKTIKERKNAETCWDKKEKAIQEKITIQLEINQKDLTKRGLKISTKSKLTQTKQNIPKQRKKIQPIS